MKETYFIVDDANKAMYGGRITGAGAAMKVIELAGYLESSISRGLETFYLVRETKKRNYVYKLTDFIRWNREEIDKAWYKKNGITRKP